MLENGCKLGLVFLFCLGISAPNFAQKTPKKAAAKIVSWNIQMLPNALGIFSAALRKKQKLREPWVVEYCNKNDYDVIVFQEVFDRDIKRKLKKHLKESYPYQVDTRTTKGKLTSNGVFFASKIPIKYIDHVIYEKGVNADGWAAKGCTLIEAEKEGVKFQIAGTHLQAGSSDEARLHRDKQYVAIRKLLDKNAKDNQAVFMLGDMNTRKSDSLKYNLMIETIEVEDFDLDEKEPYTIDGKNSWNKHDKGVQLDYIMLQKRKTNSKIILQKILRPTKEHKGKVIDLADHYGIVADIIIEN